MNIAANTPVGFRFRLSPVIGGHLREGAGVVTDETIVGTDRAYVIRVTEGPSYQPGEYLHVCARHVWRTAQ